MQAAFFKPNPVVQGLDFKIKVTVNDETKRVQVQANNFTRAATLVALAQAFPTIPLNGKTLKYVDDDGDLITCETDDEWADFVVSTRKHLKIEDKATTMKEKMAKQIVKRVQNLNKLLEANDQDSIKALALIVDAVRSGANQVGLNTWDQLIDGCAIVPSSSSHILEVDVAKGSVALKKPEVISQPQKNPLDDTWTYVEVQNQLPEVKPQPQPQQQPIVQVPQQSIQFAPHTIPQYQFPQPIPMYGSFQGPQQQVSPSPVPFQVYQQQQQQPQQMYSSQPLTASGFQQVPQQILYQQQPPRPQQVAPPQQVQPQVAPQSPYPTTVAQLREMGVVITPQVHQLILKHKGNITQILHEIYTK